MALTDTLTNVSAVAQVDGVDNYQAWIGKDYYNTFIRGLDTAEDPFTGERMVYT